jgi:Fe2+ or Zn2+ uptake regulation protein
VPQGFHLTAHELILYGSCATCANSNPTAVSA